MPATISGKTVTVLHRSAFLAARAAMSPEAGQPAAAARVSRPGPGAAQILVTTFNGILAEALHAQLGLLIPDAAVRSRIEVLNVDRLARESLRQPLLQLPGSRRRDHDVAGHMSALAEALRQ